MESFLSMAEEPKFKGLIVSVIVKLFKKIVNHAQEDEVEADVPLVPGGQIRVSLRHEK